MSRASTHRSSVLFDDVFDTIGDRTPETFGDIFLNVCVCMCMCIRMHVRMYVCVYVCVYRRVCGNGLCAHIFVYATTKGRKSRPTKLSSKGSNRPPSAFTACIHTSP